MYDQELPTIEVNAQPIELYKVLKIANMVGGGGEAKIVISEGYVFLNGEVETQKRKKIYHGDIIEFNGEAIQVIVDEQNLVEQASAAEAIQRSNLPKNNKKKKAKAQKAANSSKKPDTKSSPFAGGKRKPISF